MEYTDDGVVEFVKDKDKFQSIKFRGRKEWYSNWGDKLKIGDIINFNFEVNGTYHNINNYELNAAKPSQPQNKPFSKAQEDYKSAAGIKPSPLTNLIEVVGDAKKIMNECKNAAQEIFDTTDLKPEHTAIINTMFIYVSKEIYFRNGKGNDNYGN